MPGQFDAVAQVGASGDIVADIEAWIASPPIAALVTAFGGDPAGLADSGAEIAGRLAWFDAFTDQWDTRQQRERNEATELPLTGEQDALVLGAADALGMRHIGRPQHADYDHVIMLGGLLRACITRPAHAAALISGGVVRTESVVALGGHRPFTRNEFGLAEQVGYPELTGEYDALDQGTRAAFGLGAPESTDGEESDLVGGTWGVRQYRTDDGLRVAVAAAPSTDPGVRRANTPDSYAWFATQFAKLAPGQRVLAVTTPIYVPAQQAAALRMLALPYGVEVETIGNDPATVPPALEQTFTPTKYLLEVRSTVRALRTLLTALRESR